MRGVPSRWLVGADSVIYRWVSDFLIDQDIRSRVKLTQNPSAWLSRSLSTKREYSGNKVHCCYEIGHGWSVIKHGHLAILLSAASDLDGRSGNARDRRCLRAAPSPKDHPSPTKSRVRAVSDFSFAPVQLSKRPEVAHVTLDENMVTVGDGRLSSSAVAPAFRTQTDRGTAAISGVRS